jgi:hypothetical protein
MAVFIDFDGSHGELPSLGKKLSAGENPDFQAEVGALFLLALLRNAATTSRISS